MLLPLLLVFFAFGTVVGSFLNVVVLRYGLRTVRGRSACLSCGKILHWYELVPVVSFLFQEARCRSCGVRLSWQYPLVELLTGLVFASILWRESFLLFSPFSILHTSYFILHLTLWSLLLALSVYDLRHKIIPNALVYSAALISLILLVFSFELRASSFLLDFLSGLFMALPFAAVWFFSRGRAMGLGDAKLMLFFPWVLGLAKGLSALIVGFWLGAAVALAGLLLKGVSFSLPFAWCPALRRRLATLSLRSELPLGPFLVLGLFLVYLFGWDVTGLGMLLGQ